MWHWNFPLWSKENLPPERDNITAAKDKREKKDDFAKNSIEFSKAKVSFRSKRTSEKEEKWEEILPQEKKIINFLVAMLCFFRHVKFGELVLVIKCCLEAELRMWEENEMSRKKFERKNFEIARKVLSVCLLDRDSHFWCLPNFDES